MYINNLIIHRRTCNKDNLYRKTKSMKVFCAVSINLFRTVHQWQWHFCHFLAQNDICEFGQLYMRSSIKYISTFFMQHMRNTIELRQLPLKTLLVLCWACLNLMLGRSKLINQVKMSDGTKFVSHILFMRFDLLAMNRIISNDYIFSATLKFFMFLIQLY